MKSPTLSVAGRRRRGFTLIEMLISVVVVAIIAGVAVPTFQQQIRKSRRADAVEAMVRVTQAQERWRSNNPTYGTLTDIGVGSASREGYYSIAVTTPTATGYVLTLSAVSGKSQASDSGCTSLTVTVTNGNQVLPDAEKKCWSR